jgi:hypothetical protein
MPSKSKSEGGTMNSLIADFPVGLTPKDHETWRLTTNLSYPLGKSVNDFIDPELCQVK